MKNLILFEAFKTDKLNKTLGFINSEDGKNRFRNDLKKIGQFYDFPISDFDDNMFHYLGYQKALKLINFPDAKKCQYSYPSSDTKKYIAGEVCTGGKLKRKWGASGVRNMDCPACNGTGERKPTKKNRYLKFWFNTNGEYKGATITNSVKGSMETTFSRELNDYEVVKEFPSGAAMKRETENGDQIKINIYHDTTSYWQNPYVNPTGDMVATIIKKGTQTYAIQNSVYSNTDTWYFNRIMSNWRTFGSRITNISSPQSYLGKVSLIQRSNASTDPLYWNHSIDLNTMKASIGGDKKDILDDSNFAIVLDMDKIPEEFESTSAIRDRRSDARKDSLALQNDQDIKKANIKNYLDKISANSNVDVKNLNNLNMTFRRMLGFNNNVWQRIISGSNTCDDIKFIIDNIYECMILDSSSDDKEVTEEQIKNTIDNVIITRIRRAYGNAGHYSEQSETLRKKIHGDEDNNHEGDKEKAEKLASLLDEWSHEANKKLASIEINNIADAMVFLSKAKQISLSKFSTLSSAMQYVNRLNGWGPSYRRYILDLDQDKLKRDLLNQIQYVKSS